MPGKHGMTKYKKGMPKYKKGMPKLSEKQAKHIDTNKDGKISGTDFPINKGIGNYKGSGNFAMKNKMLSDSAKNGIPMLKNYSGMPKNTKSKVDNQKAADRLNSMADKYSDNESFRAAQTKYNQAALDDKRDENIRAKESKNKKA